MIAVGFGEQAQSTSSQWFGAALVFSFSDLLRNLCGGQWRIDPKTWGVGLHLLCDDRVDRLHRGSSSADIVIARIISASADRFTRTRPRWQFLPRSFHLFFNFRG